MRRGEVSESVCVREREREREGGGRRQTDRDREWAKGNSEYGEAK